MEKSTLERIKDIIDTLKTNGRIINKSDFAKKIGYTRTFLSDILSDKAKLSDNFINAICINFGISKEYITIGKGDVFIKNTVANERPAIYEPKNENDMTMLLKENEFLKRQLEEKDKQISKLLNLLSLTTSENEEDNKEEVA